MLFKKRKKNDDSVRKIVVKDHAPSRIIEGYNRLKDNILFMSADGNNRVIQIESALSGEGKTSIACNLAVSLGLTDKKCVIVDLDFRKPKAHMLFDLSKDIGISEYVLGTATKEDIVKVTKYKNVSLVTGGARIHNPALVLTSNIFKDLIAKLKEEISSLTSQLKIKESSYDKLSNESNKTISDLRKQITRLEEALEKESNKGLFNRFK